MPLQERCSRNHWEFADEYCNRCGLPFSNEYLVFPYGPKKPPLCVSCALAQAGVRSNAANRPVVSRRELRKRAKERRERMKSEKSASPRVSMKPIDIDWSVPDEPEPEREAAKIPRRRRATTRGEAAPVESEPEVTGPAEEEDEHQSLDWLEAYTSGEGTAKKITF